MFTELVKEWNQPAILCLHEKDADNLFVSKTQASGYDG